MADPVPCDSCGKPIIFVIIANNAGRRLKRMPLDADPDPGGNVAVRKDATGTLLGRVLTRDSKPLAGETAYCPHFATCADPAAHRRRQRGNWAATLARQRADQRRNRGRRPAPPITGVRMPPPLPGMEKP